MLNNLLAKFWLPCRSPFKMAALMAAPGFGPGSRIAVSYRADPTLWHERIVLRHLGDGLYLVLAPDLEVQQEALRASTNNPSYGGASPP